MLDNGDNAIFVSLDFPFVSSTYLVSFLSVFFCLVSLHSSCLCELLLTEEGLMEDRGERSQHLTERWSGRDKTSQGR